jgi:hypothetical protein
MHQEHAGYHRPCSSPHAPELQMYAANLVITTWHGLNVLLLRFFVCHLCVGAGVDC